MATSGRLILAVVLLVSCGSHETEPIPPGEPLVAAPKCAAATRAEPLDLIPIARLSAVGTARTLSDWTREDRDELATIREGRPLTGWRPGDEGEAVAQIDLGPAGGPFALRSLSLTWDGAPSSVEVRVRDACGGGLVARTTTSGTSIALGDVCGSCVELVVHDAAETRLVGARLESASEGARAVPLLPDPITPPITTVASGL